MRDIHLPGRSTVYGTEAAVATSQPLATFAGMEILRSGGNAVDAAIAACAVQCVVEPMGTGIGGDCFAICCLNSGERTVAINGSGRAPTALTFDALAGIGAKRVGLDSVHAVTVPGAVDAWCRLNADHGRMSMAEILEPAIRYADAGFAVAPCTAVEWAAAARRLKQNANAAAQYLNDGRAPAAGEVWRLPLLANALRAIAAQGRDGFYTGRVADDMIASLRALGGLHSAEDFDKTAASYVTPLSLRYADADIFQMPPNSQGAVALVILNILKGTNLGKFAPQSAERFHLLAEATRLAFEVKANAIGDPEFAAVEIERYLGDDFSRAMQARIRDDRAGDPVLTPAGERDTVYVSIVDRDRNVCSFINSLYMQFGSAISSEKYGIMFHNRGADFVTTPGHPNSLEPGKRPTHTILPALAMKHGKPWLSYGVKGAAYQPIGQAQIITNLLDYGMDLQAAIDDPRCAYNNGQIDVERGISVEIRRALGALGHRIAESELPLGGAQAIAIDWTSGTLAAASDPRKDGLALCC